MEMIDTYLACPQTHVVNHIPADPIVRAIDDPDFRDVLNSADMNLPDGTSVVLASRVLGVGGGERITGSTFMLDVIERCVGRGVRHGFVGGTPQVLKGLVEEIDREVPGANVAAAYSPPIRNVTAEGVREDLIGLGAECDILWVGLGTPKQQRWAQIARHEHPARAIVTVGAAFDFLSGTKRRAPKWVGTAGLEWSYRLATEPRRLWRRYLIGNPRFVWRVLRQRIAAAAQ
jgi:N-acetylglucosaminyldiphosphoundecaprenol N-acetyl-beta-D-mannosaminyltransferase